MCHLERHLSSEVRQSIAKAAGTLKAAGSIALAFALVFSLMVPSLACLRQVAYAAGDSSSAAAESSQASESAEPSKSSASAKEDAPSDKPASSSASSEKEQSDESAGKNADEKEGKADSNGKDEKEGKADKEAEDSKAAEAHEDAAKDGDVPAKAGADGGSPSADEPSADVPEGGTDGESADEASAEAGQDEDPGVLAAQVPGAKRAGGKGALEAAEPVLESAQLLILNTRTKKYELFRKTTTEGDPQKVAAVKDSASFDVQLTYSDGSTKRASKAGVKVTWKLDNNVHAGKTVVSIDSSGKMTITGAASKLVQLKASVDGVKVEGCPAFIDLVSDTPAPTSGTAIESVAISYSGSGEGAASGTVDPAHDAGSASAAATAEDGVPEEAVPAITQAGGSLSFQATVTTVDANGNRVTGSGNQAAAALVWQIVAMYDQLLERTDTIIATVQQNGQDASLIATQAGNGWVALRCASNTFVDYVGQELLVKIIGNAPVDDATVAANTIVSADLAYKDESTGTYQPYAGTIANTPTVISTPGGSVGFDVKLTLANGASALARDYGLAVDYTLAGNVSGTTPIAKMAPDGTLSATHARNGTVRISDATVNGDAVAGTSAYVRISNNDAGVQPASDPLSISALSNYWVGASQRPDDATKDWYWRAVPNSGTGGGAVPLVVSAVGTSSKCTLKAQVRWNNSTVTTSEEQDGGMRSWSVVGSTDYDGRGCGSLVSVGGDGTVAPTGTGSGYATIRCTVDLPVYDASGNKTTVRYTADYKVAVFASKSYAKKIVLLDESGKTIKTSAVKLKSGKNTYNFAALVTFVGYNEETHSIDEYEVNSKEEPQKLTGLEWKVYRTEERTQEELYSQIRNDGSFRALSGFARGYVYVNLPRASFTGKDIGVGVNVISEDSIEQLGHTDSMDVLMYHYSDYMAHGDGAKPAKQVTLTRSQLEGLADYTTWYTFHRRGDAFSTVYARGLTMRTLLAVCGVDPDRLVSMMFVGTDGYFAERHSAEFILGTQYRYTNYYYHKDLPGLVGSQSVSPMFALTYYMKNNAGYEDATDKDNAGSAGYGFMTSDSTFRVIFGMRGMGIRNANQSISNVNKIVIVVEDNTFPPDEKEEEPQPEPEPKDPEKPESLPEEQGGTPGTQGDAKASGESANPFSGQSDQGVGTDAKQGGTVAVTKKSDGDKAVAGEKDATNDHNDDKGSASGQSTQDTDVVQGEVERSGNPLIRELRENPKPVLPPAEIDAIWWMLVVMAAIAALFFGGMFQGRRYAVDRADGAMIKGMWKRA